MPCCVIGHLMSPCILSLHNRASDECSAAVHTAHRLVGSDSSFERSINLCVVYFAVALAVRPWVRQADGPALAPGTGSILFNNSKRETHHPNNGFKKLCRRLKGTYKLQTYGVGCWMRLPAAVSPRWPCRPPNHSHLWLLSLCLAE